MSPAALYGLLAWALLVGAAAASLPRARKGWVPVVAAGLALLPAVAGESLAMALHGAFSAPSFTLVLLAAWHLALPGRPSPLGGAGWSAIVGLGLVFYPLALGLGPVDPYGWGYQPTALLLTLLPVAGWLAWKRCQAGLAILALDLLAYAAGLFGNLWDAFLDPVLVLAGIAALARKRQGISPPPLRPPGA